jgi:hypothetical protein
MSADSLYAQASELFRLGRMDFIVQYNAKARWVDIFFSDGSAWWYFSVSSILGDPLQALISALVAILRYDEPVAFARWWNEPQEIRWVLRRDGDLLHIEVVELPDFARSPLASERVTDTYFETTVDFWKFAQRVRLAASRVGQTPVGDPPRYKSFEADPEYQALCDYLAEHYGR